MYKIYGCAFFNFSDVVSFGFVAFSRAGSNNIFVAETDNYFKITSFVPFFNDDYFHIEQLSDQHLYVVGDLSPIASRISGTYILEDISYYMNNLNIDDFDKFPVFQMHLSRIQGKTFADYNVIAESVSKRIFDNPEVRARWLRIETGSGWSDESFWRGFQQEKLRIDRLLLASVGLASLESVLRWLRNSGNFSDKRWTDIWGIARSMSPFDEVLAIISCEWLSYTYSEIDVDDQKYSATLEIARHVINSTANDAMMPTDFLIELFNEQPDLVYYFVDSVPARRRLERIFTDAGELDLSDSVRAVGARLHI